LSTENNLDDHPSYSRCYVRTSGNISATLQHREIVTFGRLIMWSVE